MNHTEIKMSIMLNRKTLLPHLDVLNKNIASLHTFTEDLASLVEDIVIELSRQAYGYYGNYYTPLGIICEGKILSPLETMQTILRGGEKILKRLAPYQSIRKDVLYAVVRSMDTDVKVSFAEGAWQTYENGVLLDVPERIEPVRRPQQKEEAAINFIVFITKKDGRFTVTYRNRISNTDKTIVVDRFDKALANIRESIYLYDTKIINRTGLEIPPDWWKSCTYDPHPKNYKK